MGNSYYMGGDRNDEGNYSLTNWKHKAIEDAKTGAQKVKKLPVEFDSDYYTENINKFGKFSSDYWEWVKFKNYSSAVFPFFRQMCAEFYSNFSPSKGTCLPEFVDLNVKMRNEGELISILKHAERELVNQFKTSRRTIQGRLNKNPALKRVRDYAATAWLMYLSNKGKLCVKDSVNFKKSYLNFNFNKEIDVIKAFRGCKLMKLRTQQMIKTDLLTNKLCCPNQIYNNFDVVAACNSLFESVDGFSVSDYDLILENVFERIENLKQEDGYCNLIEFYNRYESVVSLAEEIERVAARIYNGQEYRYGSFFNEINEDIFNQGEMWCKFLSQMLEDENLDPLFVKDIKKVKERLEQVLDYSNDAYQKSLEINRT